jgi:hypothetical protein
MCPFCLATAAALVASATGTGGVAALVTGKLLRRSTRNNLTQATDTKEVQHGHDDCESKAAESGFAQRMD